MLVSAAVITRQEPPLTHGVPFLPHFPHLEGLFLFFFFPFYLFLPVLFSLPLFDKGGAEP